MTRHHPPPHQQQQQQQQQPPLRLIVNAVNDNAQPRGPDRYLDELLRAMADLPDAPSVQLVVAPWQGHFNDTPLGPQGRLHRVTPPRGPIPRVLWQALVFPRIARRIGGDAVFLPNLLYTPRLHAPSLLTAHDLLQFRAPDKFGALKSRLLRWLIKRALHSANRIKSVSAFTASDITRYTATDPQKIRVIPEGGPAPAPRTTTKPDPFFLFVGKVERTKNVAQLIRAFNASDTLRALKYRLCIVGPDGNAADEVAQLLPADRVDRPGFIPEAELTRLYATTRGFVFPSTAEGFGLVLLEAMARGAPVIAANATSLPEVAGHAALLVPPDDQTALQQAMEDLASDDALFTRLQQAGYRRLGDFSWQQAAQDTLGELHDLAGRAPPRQPAARPAPVTTPTPPPHTPEKAST